MLQKISIPKNCFWTQRLYCTGM